MLMASTVFAEESPRLGDVDADLQIHPPSRADRFVHSECDEYREAALRYDPMQIEYLGMRGMFFPMPLARLVLCDVEEGKAVLHMYHLAEQELDLWGMQSTFAEDQIRVLVDTSDTLRADLANARDRLQIAEDRMMGWAHHPALWFAVGVVVTMAGTLAIAAVQH